MRIDLWLGAFIEFAKLVSPLLSTLWEYYKHDGPEKVKRFVDVVKKTVADSRDELGASKGLSDLIDKIDRQEAK